MSLARLAAIAALATIVPSPLPAQPSPQPVTISVSSFAFAPNPIRLRAGQRVTLTFVNQSIHGHDFTAKAFFAAASIGSGAAPGGKIRLAGRQSKSITLTPRAGTYPAHCSHFLHSSMGMTARIVVN